MKLNLKFLITAVFVMMIYIPAVQAQARLTFSGGSGARLSTTVLTQITYTITNPSCGNFTNGGPLFVFQGAGNGIVLGNQALTSTITFSISNGLQMQPITNENSGITVGSISANDIYVFGPSPAESIPTNSTVILSAGTATTNNNIAATKPAGGDFTTFLVNSDGVRCSANGVSAAPTAASVSVSGKVITNNRRGLSNAVIYLTDSEGNTRTARTNSFGYYRFNDIPAGQSVTVTVLSKRYQFTPQVLNLNEEMNGVNFLAEP